MAEELFRCSRCKQWFPSSGFYKDNRTSHGRTSACKGCCKKAMRVYYFSHKKEVAAYLLAHREVIVANRREYNLSHRKHRRRSTKNWYRLHRDECVLKSWLFYHTHKQRYKAYRTVARAIKMGDLVVGDCADCGKSPDAETIHAHHKDYGRPLEVIWLCQSCHQARHRTRPLSL